MTAPRPFDSTRDTELYVEGYSASFADSYPGVAVTDSLRASYRDSLANIDGAPGVFAFTIDNAGQDPVAFMVVSLSEGELPRQLSIDVLYVAEGYRRKGLGRRLLHHSQSFATEHGAAFVRLDVSAGNEPALSLYKAAGFAVTRFQLERASAA